MSIANLRRILRRLYSRGRRSQKKKPIRRQPGFLMLLEELEPRLAPSAASSSNQQALQEYGQMPISFEANAGQTSAQVQYLARGSGYALFLTATGAVLSLEQFAPAAANTDTAAARGAAPPASVSGVALAMNLLGGNAQATVTGLDQLPGASNYLIGNDPGQWRTNIANYAQVAYQDVYPGVNLIYYGDQQQLEYDFVVAPGANPASIRFDVQGAASVSLDNQGNLVLSTSLGDVLEHAPVVYQEVDGARQAVAGQFVVLGQDEIGFQVGSYDASLPLTIDPVLSYSTYVGGTGGANGGDSGYGIAVDKFGDAYITGSTFSSNFPTTTGVFQTNLGGATGNAFITKLNPTGTALIYSTYLGGSGGDYGQAIAVDSAGDAYVTGSTFSTNFPTTPGAVQASLGGSNGNAFVTKLNPTGTTLLYSTYLGGSGGDLGQSIAVDNAGDVYVAGGTSSADFPTTTAAFQTTYGGNGNAFVTKLNPNGTALLYSTYLGGSGGDYAQGIALDSSGNAYVTGSTSSIDFPITVGAYQITLGGSFGNAFVTKLNPSGAGLVYSTYLGGNEGDFGQGIALDGAGNAYVTGSTYSANFPTTINALQIKLGGSNGNAFVTELNSNGSALGYSTFLGGSGGDYGQSIAVDGAGEAYVTGATLSSDFPTTAGALQTTLVGANSAFFTKLSANGSALVYSTYLGGTGDDYGYGIALDSLGNAYVTGQAGSTNFPTTTGAYQANLDSAGAANAFVAKFTFSTLVTQTATKLVISNLNPTNVTAGGAVTFTVTAEDSNNNPVPSYTGTIKLTSTDPGAQYNGAVLPATYTFVASDSGSHTFTVTLETAGSQTITVTDQANSSLTATTSPITVVAGSFGEFALTVLGGNTIVAGTQFLLEAQATDGFGNPIGGLGVPASITASATPADPQVNYSLNAPVNSSGFAFFLGTLETVGSYTLSAGGGSVNVTVTPASTDDFTVSTPALVTTGAPFNVTVKAFDRFGNPTPGYTGTVSVINTDPAASVLVPSYTFKAAENGVHIFSVILDTSTLGGSTGTTIFVKDTSATTPPITGFSPAIEVQGLVVAPSGFQPTATGFTVTFSKPFTPADLTEYGSNLTTVQDVTLVGASSGPIPGSMYLDPTTPNTLVFKASSAYLLAVNAGDGFGPGGNGDISAALPDDTYTVTLVSGTGTNGFVDALNTHLDGLDNGAASNWTTTFTTTYQDDAHNNAHPTPILAIPDFARGPDSSSTITVPNNKTAPGIPITLYNVTNSVTDATFTLTYNPQIFTPTAGSTGDAPAGSTFTMGTITSIDSTHSSAVFTYHNGTGHTGTIVLGDIIATVPNSADSIYKTKELLALSKISITGGATVQASDGIHVDAYLGDVHVTAAPAIDASDALDASKVAAGAWTGFSSYTLLDPAIIGGFVFGHTISVDPADVTSLFTKAAHGTVPTLPNIPSTVTTVSVGGADPAVSLGDPAQTANGVFSVPVLLDDPDPAGSTGMTEAHLALSYDPSVLSVTSADISLGSIPSLGTSWQISAEVDAATGQIAINLFNLARTPITSTQAGSLVTIAFQVLPGSTLPANPVQLVSQAMVNGQLFVTEVDDDQGPFTLTLDTTQAASGILLIDRVFADLAAETPIDLFLFPDRTSRSKGNLL